MASALLGVDAAAVAATPGGEDAQNDDADGNDAGGAVTTVVKASPAADEEKEPEVRVIPEDTPSAPMWFKLIGQIRGMLKFKLPKDPSKAKQRLVFINLVKRFGPLTIRLCRHGSNESLRTPWGASTFKEDPKMLSDSNPPKGIAYSVSPDYLPLFDELDAFGLEETLKHREQWCPGWTEAQVLALQKKIVRSGVDPKTGEDNGPSLRTGIFVNNADKKKELKITVVDRRDKSWYHGTWRDVKFGAQTQAIIYSTNLYFKHTDKGEPAEWGMSFKTSHVTVFVDDADGGPDLPMAEGYTQVTPTPAHETPGGGGGGGGGVVARRDYGDRYGGGEGDYEFAGGGHGGYGGGGGRGYHGGGGGGGPRGGGGQNPYAGGHGGAGYGPPGGGYEDDDGEDRDMGAGRPPPGHKRGAPPGAGGGGGGGYDQGAGKRARRV